MKKMIIGLATLVSLQSYALVCSSLEGEDKQLILYKKNNVQEGIILNKGKISSFMIGKMKIDLLSDKGPEYTLFDENGEKLNVTVSYDSLPSNHSGSCRARVCPSNGYNDIFQVKAKLSYGESVEYFECL